MLRPDPSAVDPARLVSLFAEVFASLDAFPRPVEVTLDLGGAEGFALDCVAGEPVFSRAGAVCAASFRRRWLAEHPVPLALGRTTRLRFEPTHANRVRVRVARRLFGRLPRWPRLLHAEAVRELVSAFRPRCF